MPPNHCTLSWKSLTVPSSNVLGNLTLSNLLSHRSPVLNPASFSHVPSCKSFLPTHWNVVQSYGGNASHVPRPNLENNFQCRQFSSPAGWSFFSRVQEAPWWSPSWFYISKILKISYNKAIWVQDFKLVKVSLLKLIKYSMSRLFPV